MKKVFEYMGWDKIEDCDACDLEYCEGSVLDLPECRYRGDGNDMVLAINAMSERGIDIIDVEVIDDNADYRKDYAKFIDFCFDKFIRETGGGSWVDMSAWLFGDPQKFFELMEEWLNEKAD